MPPASLQRAWKMRPWMRRLSGLTLNPLMQQDGVDAWISSLQAIRASHSPLPERKKQKPTQDISGHTSGTLSMLSAHGFVFSRTSPTTYVWASSKSMMTYPQWVTALRRVCLQRKKSAQRISASDCSFWPTVTATDANVNKARPPEKMIRKDGRNVLRTPSLAETVMQPDGFPYTKQDLARQKSGKNYRAAKIQWPTPRAQEPGSTSPTHGNGLAETARQWLTPRAAESGEKQETFLKRMNDRTENAHSSLAAQAKAWPTPCARDWKDTAGMKPRVSQQISLPFLAFRSGRPRPGIMNNGDMSQMRLNPAFTEWLMGWPIGWTDFGSAETEWCHWWQLMRSRFYTALYIHETMDQQTGAA